MCLVEVASLFVLNYRQNTTTKKSTTEKQTSLANLQIVSAQQSDSCSNWFARYKYIDSTETITKGTFSRLEVSKLTKEAKIILTNGASEYYVMYEKDVTKLSVLDNAGKAISINQLKKGDLLKVIEGYKKLADNKDDFSVIVMQEKL